MRQVAFMLVTAIIGMVGGMVSGSAQGNRDGQITICREISWQSKTCLEIRKELLGENE